MWGPCNPTDFSRKTQSSVRAENTSAHFISRAYFFMFKNYANQRYIFLRFRFALPHQPYPRKLPSQWRMKKIAVGMTAVAFRSCYRTAPQHHLVYHELSVVLAYGAGSLPESRIGQIGAFGPFPTLTPV